VEEKEEKGESDQDLDASQLDFMDLLRGYTPAPSTLNPEP